MVVLLLLSAEPATSLAAEPARSQPQTMVVLHTAGGDIRIALEMQRAPITSQNFLRYVDAGRFDGTTFYRAMTRDGSEGLVQGGLQGNNRKAFPPIAHESTVDTGLSHTNGAVSMARQEPGSARGEFFIVVGEHLTYDGVPNGGDEGFAVFGRVVSGMPVVRRILRQPRSTEARSAAMKNQMLAQPVVIETARRAP